MYIHVELTQVCEDVGDAIAVFVQTNGKEILLFSVPKMRWTFKFYRPYSKPYKTY